MARRLQRLPRDGTKRVILATSRLSARESSSPRQRGPGGVISSWRDTTRLILRTSTGDNASLKNDSTAAKPMLIIVREWDDAGGCAHVGRPPSARPCSTCDLPPGPWQAGILIHVPLHPGRLTIRIPGVQDPGGHPESAGWYKRASIGLSGELLPVVILSRQE